MTKKKIKLKNVLIVLLFFSFCFQNLNLIEFSNFGFKPYHFLAIILLPLLFKNDKIKLPPKLFMVYYTYIIGISAIAYLKYGLNNLFLNYIFGFYLILIIINVFKDTTFDEWISIMQKVAWLCILSVLVKDLIYIQNIISFLKSPYGHPIIPTFLGGGPNLEASWLALLGMGFYKNKKGFIYGIISLIISAVYSSRVGIIGNVLLFVFLGYQLFFASNKDHKKDKNYIMKQLIKLIIIIIIMAIIMAIISLKLNIFKYITERFFEIGNDSGSQGRLDMWKYVYQSFKLNPFGYGIGNAINSIEAVSSLVYSESNVHNLLFQKLLDTGFIGMIFYLYILFKIFKTGYKKFFKNPFVAFIVSYFILSFVQYRGGDSILFFVLGIYYSLEFNKESESNN